MILSIFNNPGVSILIAALIIAFSIVFIILLIRSVKRERLSFMETNLGSDKFSAESMQEFIRKRILSANKKTFFSILQIDIHDHKTLNENFGEIQYKNLIGEIEDKLIALMPENTKVSSNQKSIFFYIKSELSLQQQSYLAEMMLAEMQKPFTLVGALKIEVDINIGGVRFPESGKTYDDLMHSLELAMIVSKRKGLNNFIIYNKALANEETDEYRYYKEIKEAIENKDFTLYYQPVVDLSSGEVYGAESLLRWQHKTLGVLPPSKFLNIIEHSGDIYWVGIWAFEQLLKHYNLISRSITDKKIYLSMNLSPKQLINPELPTEFRRLLKKYNAIASNFSMEIVEFAMFDKMEIMRENIFKLRQIGFKITLDNYGLELSSLAQLSKLSIDIIKIDKAFLAQTEENAMVGNIVEMLIKYSNENDVKLIAEGIENKEILNKILSFKIKYGQGYYFSKPKDVTNFIADINLTPWQ